MEDTIITPILLKKAPLVEAIFEMRFKAAKESAGDLLPGLIYSAMDEKYESVETLPIASIPREFRIRENLQYQPLHRLSKDNKQILVGDHTVLLSQTPPYSGWKNFQAMIIELIHNVRQTRLLEKLERFSVKCINIIPCPTKQQLSLLNTHFEIAGQPVSDMGFKLRTEINVSDFVNIVQIITNSNINLRNGETRSGLLVDVDTIRSIDSTEFFGHESEHLEAAHQTLKSLFFSLLTKNTIESFDPEWRLP